MKLQYKHRHRGLINKQELIKITIYIVLENCHTCDGKSITLRTRSLPTHVRNKKRPFSTSDNLSELYAKVFLILSENCAVNTGEVLYTINTCEPNVLFFKCKTNY